METLLDGSWLEFQQPDCYIFLLLYLLLQVQLEVKVWFVQDQLRGSDTTEIRVKFIKKLEDAVPAGED